MEFFGDLFLTMVMGMDAVPHDDHVSTCGKLVSNIM